MAMSESAFIFYSRTIIYLIVKIPAVRAGIESLTVPFSILTSETLPCQSVKVAFAPNGSIIETSNETFAAFASLLKIIKTAWSTKIRA